MLTVVLTRVINMSGKIRAHGARATGTFNKETWLCDASKKKIADSRWMQLQDASVPLKTAKQSHLIKINKNVNTPIDKHVTFLKLQSKR